MSKIKKLKAKLKAQKTINDRIRSEMISQENELTIIRNSRAAISLRHDALAQDNATKDRIIKIREQTADKQKYIEKQNFKEFERLRSDYQKAVSFINAITTNLKIDAA